MADKPRTEADKFAREFTEELRKAGHSWAEVVEYLEAMADRWEEDLPEAAQAYRAEAKRAKRLS